MKIVITLFIILFNFIYATEYGKVQITPDLTHLYVYHKGKAVKVHRIQNIHHKLTGEYAKVYRPKKYIQPIKIAENIKTIGEIELLDFMQKKVNRRMGIVIDIRSKKEYKRESIPSAVNIPFKTSKNSIKMEKIFKIFGIKKRADGTLDTHKALDIVFYCNGLWCSKSPRFIKVFLEMGYPAKKIFYYRGGFQMWKILGFTTVINK